MYRTYSKTTDSFQGGFEFLLKKWYILEEFLPILRLISWSLPDDEGDITCMRSLQMTYVLNMIRNSFGILQLFCRVSKMFLTSINFFVPTGFFR